MKYIPALKWGYFRGSTPHRARNADLAFPLHRPISFNFVEICTSTSGVTPVLTDVKPLVLAIVRTRRQAHPRAQSTHRAAHHVTQPQLRLDCASYVSTTQQSQPLPPRAHHC